MDAQQRFEHWYRYPHLDAHVRQELEQMVDQPVEIQERFATYLNFGTGGMRGEIGAGTNRLNIYTIRKATLGLAHYLHNQVKEDLNVQPTADQQQRKKNQPEKSVVIAYDCRQFSAHFAKQAALTLAEQRIKVYLFPSLRSTPQLSFSVRALNASAGIVITASHNPPEYNGYKVYGADGAQLNVEEADQVIHFVHQVQDELQIAVMEEEQALEGQWLVMLDESFDEQYLDYVSSLTLQPDVIRKWGKRFKLVFTPLHGTALKPVQKVLAKAGFQHVQTVAEQEEPDPFFSTVDSPNPEEHAAFRLAIQYGERHGADMLVGTDPDADRMGIAVKNKEGHYQVLTGNQTGALLLHYILTHKKAKGELSAEHTLCKTIVTSELGRDIARSFGLETIDTLTGFKFIGEKIKQFKASGERQFIFGYEESYGYLFGDEVRDKDAIQAVLLAAEMGAYYRSKGMTVYDALENIYETYGYYEEDVISITLKGKEGMEKMERVLNTLRATPPGHFGGWQVVVVEDYLTQKRTDVQRQEEEPIRLPASNVLKYHVQDGSWLCVRPSGTEPKLKIYIGVKAASQKEASSRMERLKQEAGKLV